MGDAAATHQRATLAKKHQRPPPPAANARSPRVDGGADARDRLVAADDALAAHVAARLGPRLVLDEDAFCF